MIQAIVLGTYTIFSYNPSEDECKQLYARMNKVPVSSLEGKDLAPADAKEMKARLIAAEKGLLYTARHCKGDASETGLVQFAQGCMDLDSTRAAAPTFVYKNNGKETECLIPFSSDIKFNAFIRDMSGAKDPNNDNLCVYMKGAPERILTRCSRILVNGEEVDFSEELRAEVNEANAKFGEM